MNAGLMISNHFLTGDRNLGSAGFCAPSSHSRETLTRVLAEIDESRGHNIFLKIYSEGWIVDVISYI